MATLRKSTSTAQARSRSTTAAASRRSKGGPVRVWSECSVTVAVSEDPPQFIKFTHGFEAMSPTDDPADVRRTERYIYDTCEKVVDLRVRKMRRLMRQIGA